MHLIEAQRHYQPLINNGLESFLGKQRFLEPFLQDTYGIIKKYIENGGKRLRPLLAIQAYDAFGGQSGGIFPAAIALELLHNSTLIHDDIIDEDERRRGKPTTHAQLREMFRKDNKEVQYDGTIFSRRSSRFCVATAICAGNILYALSLRSLSETDTDDSSLQRCQSILTDAIQIVNNGQLLDLAYETSDITENEYLGMIEKKTGNLFKASVEMGAILGQASPSQFTLISRYAKRLALAFQIRDDLMDIDPQSKKANTFGSDIRRGKLTLMAIVAQERCDSSQKALLSGFGNPQASPEQIEQVIRVFQDTKAIDYTRTVAQTNVESALDDLKHLDIPRQNKEFFEEFAGFMIQRDC